MATPSSEEIQEFYKEETEYQDPQENFEDIYRDAVDAGNANDDD